MRMLVIVLICLFNAVLAGLYLRNQATAKRGTVSFSRFVSNMTMATVWLLGSIAVLVVQVV